jgi:hypothetical protein
MGLSARHRKPEQLRLCRPRHRKVHGPDQTMGGQNAPDDASLSLARQPPGGFALPSDKTIHAIGLLLVTLVVTSAAAR